MKDVLEKRKGARQQCAVPIEGKKKSAFAGSQTVDISRGGAGLITHGYVPVNTKMAIEIDLSPEGESVVAVGQVRWVQVLPGQESYRVGLSFTNIAADAQSRLRKFFR